MNINFDPNNLDIEAIKGEILAFKPYILNVKAIAGILAIGYVIYAGFTEVPKKWQGFMTAKGKNQELITSKQNLSNQEAQLNAISKELDKQQTRIFAVKPGDSPELTVINLAQQLIDLSEATQNTYVNLQPNQQTTYNVNNLVSLPIEVPGGADASAQSPAATPSGGGGGGGGGGGAALKAYVYTLRIKGTYPTLIHFLHELARYPQLIVVNNVKITPAAGEGEDKGASLNELLLVVNFTIPWRQGNPEENQPPPKPKPLVPPEVAPEGAGGAPPEGAGDGKSPAKNPFGVPKPNAGQQKQGAQTGGEASQPASQSKPPSAIPGVKKGKGKAAKAGDGSGAGSNAQAQQKGGASASDSQDKQPASSGQTQPAQTTQPSDSGQSKVKNLFR